MIVVIIVIFFAVAFVFLFVFFLASLLPPTPWPPHRFVRLGAR